MADTAKGLHENFARFFEAPSRESLRELLRNHFGERNELDFKGDWPQYPVVARHLLGFANSGGGCIVFGISQKSDNTFEISGLPKIADKADIQRNVQKYIPSQLQYNVLDFAYEASEYPTLIGKKFQVLLIEDDPRYIPFIAEAEGQLIRKAAIYVRRGTSTEEADYKEVQEILNRRLETSYSSQSELTLEQHISELRLLYQQISITRQFSFISMLSNPFEERNPTYPKEDFESFIARMIKLKKQIIQAMIEGKRDY
jgi:predicted HTH transcriptional regulator